MYPLFILSRLKQYKADTVGFIAYHERPELGSLTYKYRLWCRRLIGAATVVRLSLPIHANDLSIGCPPQDLGACYGVGTVPSVSWCRRCALAVLGLGDG